MYPFFSNVKIEEVAAVPDGAAATAEKTCEGVRMTNGLVELEFDPTKGGGLKSMKLADERVEQVRDGRSFAVVDSLPGPFRDHALRAEAASDAKGATLVQTLDGSSRGYSFAQRATLAADAAEIGFGFTIGNRDKVVKKFSFNYHPELALGSAADSADSFVVPLADGSVRSVQWRGGAGAIRFTRPAGPWMAVVDSGERLALVTEFDPAKLHEVYCYDASSFYTVEPTSPSMELPIGGDYSFAFSWLFFRGLTGVDSVAGRFAAHLEAPGVWDQSRPFAATLQLSTANRGMCAVSASVRLLKGGAAAAEATADGPGGVAFDLPSSIAVGGDFSRLPDGEYELAVDVSVDGGAKMSFRRPLRLAGGWFARISAFIAGKAREIAGLAKSAPASRVFDLQLRLKALEEAVAANRLDEAERLMREFSDVVVSAEGPGFTNALQRVSEGRWSGDGVEVCMSTDGVVKVSSPAKALERVRVGFPRTFAAGTKFFKDAWERTGGDSGWRAEADFDFSPWYTMAYGPGGEFAGFGVQVRPNSLVAWRRTADGLEATLDVSSGGRPVRLGGRTLVAAKFVFMEGRRMASAFEGARAFAAMMCPSPRLAKAPVYGYNDWYCAYGSNTATNFLADAAFVCSLAEGLSNRPYVVMDDGWQKNSPPVVKAYNANGAGGSGYGPWDESGERFGMAMAPFAAAVRRLGARPGLWYRPYRAWPGADASLRSSTRKGFFDPTIPEVRRMVFEDVRRFREWGFELVKIDYLTFDLCGLYGTQMGDRVFHGDCGWRDDTRTSAEVVNELHDVMREAAGDGVVIIGCNALNHLVAGLFELQRTGDDTSGWKWEQTRQKGVNTLAARGFQDRIFFAVDADCAGLAREGAVDWSKNRQWIDLLGRSGTPFFVSWRRSLANDEVRAALRAAFRNAASPRAVAEPLDWLERAVPVRWRLADGETEYDW